MAKMFPNRFPDPANKMRNAEKAFFEACSSQLDDDWTVLYDVKYFGQRSQGAERGDIDFLMMHGELGIFCVEVKGGRRIYLQDGSQATESGQANTRRHTRAY